MLALKHNRIAVGQFSKSFQFLKCTPIGGVAPIVMVCRIVSNSESNIVWGFLGLAGYGRRFTQLQTWLGCKMSRMSDEENAALVIKTGVEQLLVPLRSLLDKLLGPASTELGLSLGDSAKVWRFKRQIRLFQEVKRLVDQSGLNMSAIPTRLFFPVLEAASVEDNDDMQTRWAALLANEATTIGTVHPSFIDPQ